MGNDPKKPHHPIPRVPNTLAVPNHVESDDEKSGISEMPLPLQLTTRTRDISKTTLSTQAEVVSLRGDIDNLRGDLKNYQGRSEIAEKRAGEYMERDIAEHAEIREHMRSMDARSMSSNEHIGSLRENTAKMSGSLELLARDAARREKEEAEKKGETKAKVEHRRHFLVAAIGLAAAIVGFLAHAIGFGH